jgi:hypothetical protein
VVGQFLPEVSKNYRLVYGLIPRKMKMVCPFKMSGRSYPTAWHNSLEDCFLKKRNSRIQLDFDD